MPNKSLYNSAHAPKDFFNQSSDIIDASGQTLEAHDCNHAVYSIINNEFKKCPKSIGMSQLVFKDSSKVIYNQLSSNTERFY